MAGIYAPNSLEGTDEILEKMWREAEREIAAINPKKENWKIQTLPLARVKKIMKAEEFCMQELEKDRLKELGKPEDEASKIKFMIAADAPILLSRASELLIRELTSRAWQHTERNKRRTLQRQDIHAAVGESEVYDFLIDIVPRVSVPSRTTPQPAAGLPAYGIPAAGDPAAAIAGQPADPSYNFYAPTQQAAAPRDNSEQQDGEWNEA